MDVENVWGLVEMDTLFNRLERVVGAVTAVEEDGVDGEKTRASGYLFPTQGLRQQLRYR